MLVGIHKNSYEGLDKYAKVFETILDYNGIETERLDISDVDFWGKVRQLDLFIYRWNYCDDHHQIARSIIPIIERKLGIKCFPNIITCWHYDDKIKQYYLLREHNFPITQSWAFYDKDAALRWTKKAKFPVVFKLKAGAGSINIVLIKSARGARRIIKRMFGKGILPTYSGFGDVQNWFLRSYFNLRHSVGQKLRGGQRSPFWQVHKDYVFFQKFLMNNDYDTRITVIGDRAFAFRRLNRVSDFRSSGSGRIDYDMDKIDLKFVSKALEISQALGFQSMAYDSLYDENRDISFCEISYTYVASAVYHCPGYWDKELRWHEGHYWPQYFQLVDILGLPDLKQPEIKP